MGSLCEKVITCPNKGILRYAVSERVALFVDVIAAEISWTRRRLNTIKMAADRVTKSITCKSTGGRTSG
jgi:hypothetical protein